MPVKDHALMLGPQQAAAHVPAHSPETDHSNLHVWCAPRVGWLVFAIRYGLFSDSIRAAPAGSRFQNYGRDIGKVAGGSPGPIPCARINCRASPRMAGKRRAKMAPPTRHVTPPMATVKGAPI